MKFAFISLDFKRYPLEFCFDCADYYGFDGVEICTVRNHLYPDSTMNDQIKNIREWKKKYHLDVPMLVPILLNADRGIASVHENERADSIQWIKQHIDMAQKIECPRVLVTPDHPGYGVDRASSWQAFVASIQELSDYAKGTGVRLTCEPLTPMESPILCRTDDCLSLLRDANRDNVHFMMDIVPPTIVFEPFSDYFSKLGSKMDYIHICNNDGVTDAHQRLENGIIPVEDMFAVFKHWNYDGFVSTELYSEAYRDPELLLANSVRVLRGICDRLEIPCRLSPSGKK